MPFYNPAKPVKPVDRRDRTVYREAGKSLNHGSEAMNDLRKRLDGLLEALGGAEEPIGVFYSDREPALGFAPKPGPAVSAELEQAGAIDFKAVFENFSCVLGNIWMARKKGMPAWLTAERYGCPGASFHCGFHAPQLEFIARYVSTGAPQAAPGERYLPSPEAVRGYFDALSPRPAPARVCVFKPLSLLEPGEEPEVVVFFARGEVLGGLCQLACFATGDVEAVALPFGAGCASILAWPLRYLEQGRERAVVGGPDPSCRKFLKVDELTFAAPWSLFRKMLDAWPDSFLAHQSWEGPRKKALRSRRTWGEDGTEAARA